jgi:hypothetical protein
MVWRYCRNIWNAVLCCKMSQLLYVCWWQLVHPSRLAQNQGAWLVIMMHPSHHEVSCFGELSVTIWHPMFSDSLCKVSHFSRHQITLEFDTVHTSSRNPSLYSINLLAHSFWSQQFSYSCAHLLDCLGVSLRTLFL